jgi:hypothetical protein
MVDGEKLAEANVEIQNLNLAVIVGPGTGVTPGVQCDVTIDDVAMSER